MRHSQAVTPTARREERHTPALHTRLPSIGEWCSLDQYKPLREGLLDVLYKYEAYYELHASERETTNKWFLSFHDFYDRKNGAARDCVLPVGHTAVKNFKAKVVNDFYPTYEAIIKAKAADIVKEGTESPTEYDELPLDKYELRTLEQYSEWKSFVKKHDDTVAKAKKKMHHGRKKMNAAEATYGMTPQGAGGVPPFSNLKLPPKDSIIDVEASSDDVQSGSDFESDEKPPASVGRKRHKHPTPETTKPPAGGDANLDPDIQHPLDNLEGMGRKLATEFGVLRDTMFPAGSATAVASAESSKKDELQGLYAAEKHHRSTGNIERADKFKDRIEKLEKEVYGI